MTDNVVQLRPSEDKAPMIWTCGCGSQQFYLYDTGLTECYICGTEAPNGTWRENVKEDPATRDVEVRTSTSHSTPELARAAIMKKAKDDPDTLAVGVLYRDGRLSGWIGDEENERTEVHRSWVRRRFAALAALILGEPEPKDNEHETE